MGINSYRTKIVMLHDAIMSVLAFIFAFQLRSGTFYPKVFENPKFVWVLLCTLAAQIFSFHLNGLYKPIWRFASLNDLVRILKGVATAIPLAVLVLFIQDRMLLVPRSIFIIDALVLTVLLGSGRIAYRLLRERLVDPKYKKGDTPLSRVVIIGAGKSGVKLSGDIVNDHNLKMKVIAFVDDSKYKIGRLIHNIPVRGGISRIEEIIKETGATQIFIATPSATDKEMREILRKTQNLNIEIKTLPKLSNILKGNVNYNQLRNIELEDLVGRKETKVDLQSMEHMINGKTILVTGAGGSIGSELSNQILNLSPKKIVLFEQCEYFLYKLERDLSKKYPSAVIYPFLADIKCRERVEQVFESFNPEVVFHAAAYKHVTMIEINPSEAITTNVMGTKTLAELASKHNVEKFVLVSTDKAINPTSIMGATKRIAEMVCQNIQKNSQTKFITVRFGNVVGSSGSVIPLFEKQIKEGGPVTVTHSEVTRYFMTIPEASRLVIQASTLGTGGEVFVLDMGTPIKIIDIAKQMISLNGLTLGKDIDIEIIGLRPGEKLFEELFASDEAMIGTEHELVKVAKVSNTSENFEIYLKEILTDNIKKDHLQLKNLIKKIVPEFIYESTLEIDDNKEEQLSH